MPNRMLRFNFKLVYTSKTCELDVNSEMNLGEFITWINEDEQIRQLFNIHEHYDLQIVACGNKVNGDAELAPPIDAAYETIGEKFNPKTTAFYIRPVDPITEEFIRRDDYSIKPIDSSEPRRTISLD